MAASDQSDAAFLCLRGLYFFRYNCLNGISLTKGNNEENKPYYERSR